jgi:hypothetical protein
MALFGDVGQFFEKAGKGLANMVGAGSPQEVADLPYLEQQKQLIDALIRRGSGQTPSLAEAASQQALQKALANTASALGSEAGLNPAQRAMLATQAGNQAQTDIAQQAMLGRLQEQQMAEQQLGETIGQAQSAAMGRQQQISQNYNQMMANRANLFGNIAQAGAKIATAGKTTPPGMG